MNTELVLIDGSAFLFRSYFANLRQNLTNNEGFPTGAIFGVISSIKKLERKYPNAKLIVIFDHKDKNFRHDIYPEYKAHRKPAEDDLVIQIEPLYEIIQAMGYHFLCIDKVEADDTIATLAKLADKKNMQTVIASGDKDLYQLLSDNITQLDMKDKVITPTTVIEKMGITTHQILDLLALSGDSADNIPGVPSVGPKTAMKWLQQYQTIENIKQHANEITGKVGEKLRTNFDKLDLSYELVKLKFDVKLPIDIWDTEPQKNEEKLQQLLTLYGFKSWLDAKPKNDNKPIEQNIIENSTQNANQNITDKYSQRTILKNSDFEQLLGHLNQCRYFTFDLETTGLDYMNDTIVGLVFLIDTDGYYLPIAHSYMGVTAQLKASFVLTKLTPILENPKIGKIGQNLKYDSHILKNHRINLEGIIADTMLMSYCLNSTATKHNMDDLALFYLNYQTTHFMDIAGSGKNQLCFNQIDIAVAAKYAIEDVFITKELFDKLSNELIKTPSLYKLYQRIELPLIATMVRIERNGVNLDSEKLHNQHITIFNKITQIAKEIYAMVGFKFNLDSPKQLQQVLFGEDGLNIEPLKKTKTGAISTNEEALKLIDHPIITLLLEYRTLSKLNSTYLIALPRAVDTTTKRLHTSYHQSGTATGRLSSSKPNLQNIPIRSEEGAKIRSAFVAQSGYKIIAGDYSQVELRIMAHISGDKNLIKAFNNGEDIHKSTASLMFKTALNEVTREQRRNAKAINFGLMYGMGPFNLAKQIKESRTVAKQYIADYFTSYPQVKAYMDGVKITAQDNNFVETIMGRRLFVPAINSTNKIAAAHALRTAINAPMQGSSADIIKKAMLEIHKIIRNNNQIKMIMQVHDELVFEVIESEVDSFSQQLIEIMQNVVTLKVPLIVDIGVGNNWQEAH